MNQRPDPELIQAAKDFVTWASIVSDHHHDEKYLKAWVIVTYDPETEHWDARGPFTDPRQAEQTAKESLDNITADGQPPYHQIIMPLYDYGESMTTAFKCDGCLKHFDGEPTFTIERTDDIATLTGNRTLHACSWPCVETIGRARTITAEER